MTPIRRSPAFRKTQIVRMLKTRTRTTNELSQAMGINPETVRKYISEMHGKRVHVADWLLAEDGRVSRLAVLWAPGPGPDAPRPAQWHCSEARGDADEAVYISASRRRALAHAATLARELRKLPAANPLQALVVATLYANQDAP